MKRKMPDNQRAFYSDIREILKEARSKAYASVNFAMVEAYWKIGRRIVEEEQKGKERAGYGEYLIKTLSKELTAELGKGFSYANLWNFRQCYQVFPTADILYTLCRELSWSQLRLIMRVENSKARHYYLEETRKQQWSVRQLQRNINSLYYERMLSASAPATIDGKNIVVRKEPPPDFIKDPYVLEFLNLSENPFPKENIIETAIISNLQSFLLEMGKGFSFVGRQYRISSETRHFYIDLVFYNYVLKCFVLIDIKADQLTHQDIGQMDTYVRMFDDLKCGADDNPTIGIILCASKDETIVKYSVLKGSEKIFASKYRLVLPTEAELIAELERGKQLFLEGREQADE